MRFVLLLSMEPLPFITRTTWMEKSVALAASYSLWNKRCFQPLEVAANQRAKFQTQPVCFFKFSNKPVSNTTSVFFSN